MPLSNFVPWGFGFAHHSIAILYHEVPNPHLTIRNFLIAVGGGEPSTARAKLAMLTDAAQREAVQHAVDARTLPSLHTAMQKLRIVR